MGKVSIIAAILVSVVGFTLLGNMQSVSRETNERHAEYLTGQVARELALTGRKLVLASWINAAGASFAPFDTIHHDGGLITIDQNKFSVVDGIIDFTVRAVYDGDVHDVRSRYRYNTFAANPLQIKAGDIDFDIALEGTGELNLDRQGLTPAGKGRIPTRYIITLEAPLLALINQARLSQDFRLQYQQMQNSDVSDGPPGGGQ